MQLEELKHNMSVLDQILAKTTIDIKINFSASESAQSKILKRFRRNAINCLILAIVFLCMWMGNVEPEKLPTLFKAYIFLMGALATGWYLYLYKRLKGISVSKFTPVEFLSETTKVRILTLSGEIFFGIVLAVFFTLLLSFFLINNPLAFKLSVAIIVIGITIGVLYSWPRYIKLFQDLSSID